MDFIRAKEIVRRLADGIDPRTGELFPADSVYNSPEVIRALFTLLERATWEEQRIHLRNAGKPWSVEEDASVQKAYLERMSISDIAKAHGRSRGAIISRLEQLGLRKKNKPY